VIIVKKALHGIDQHAPLLPIGIPGRGSQRESMIGEIVTFTDTQGNVRGAYAAIPDTLREVGHSVHNGRIGIVIPAKIIGSIDIIPKVNRLTPIEDNQSRRLMGGLTALILQGGSVGRGLVDRNGPGGSIRWRYQLAGQELYVSFCRHAIGLCGRRARRRWREDVESGQQTENDQKGDRTGKLASKMYVHDVSISLLVDARPDYPGPVVALPVRECPTISAPRVESRRETLFQYLKAR
jgi:hypothetical protein